MVNEITDEVIDDLVSSYYEAAMNNAARGLLNEKYIPGLTTIQDYLAARDNDQIPSEYCLSEIERLFRKIVDLDFTDKSERNKVHICMELSPDRKTYKDIVLKRTIWKAVDHIQYYMGAPRTLNQAAEYVCNSLERLGIININELDSATVERYARDYRFDDGLPPDSSAS